MYISPKLCLTLEIKSKYFRTGECVGIGQTTVLITLISVDHFHCFVLQDIYGNRGYIASQGPVKATVDDFWKMLWQYEVKVVAMACRLVEMGRVIMIFITRWIWIFRTYMTILYLYLQCTCVTVNSH